MAWERDDYSKVNSMKSGFIKKERKGKKGDKHRKLEGDDDDEEEVVAHQAGDKYQIKIHWMRNFDTGRAGNLKMEASSNVTAGFMMTSNGASQSMEETIWIDNPRMPRFY